MTRGQYGVDQAASSGMAQGGTAFSDVLLFGFDNDLESIKSDTMGDCF